MSNDGSREGLAARVEELGVDSTNIEKIIVSYSSHGRRNHDYVIPNVPGKDKSIRVFAGVANKSLMIGREEAKQGLEVFGPELVGEAAIYKGKHPNIDLLQDIAETKISCAQLGITGHKMPVPFSRELIENIVNEHSTPFHIYDEQGIRDVAVRLKSTFSWVEDFKNYFAVKATPNPHILKIMKEEGFGTDCSSLPELIMSERVGITGENVMFTSNDTPAEEYQKAREMGAIINLDDITHISFLEEHAGIPELICFRYNPGPLREGNEFIGDPREAKYGLTHEQLPKAYQIMKDKGVKRFGLHTMIVSNMINPEYLIETAEMLFDLVVDVSKGTGIRFEFVNTGGGIGIPYKPDEEAVDLEYVSEGIREAYEEKIVGNGLDPLRVVMECGRLITGPNGFLVTKVRHVAEKYKDYVGLDTCMADLMRPALYGAYHHITVLGKEDEPLTAKYDVTGSLCENNDKFAINRFLPELNPEDIIVMHNAGAHGHAMGFQYNGKLRLAELLAREDKSVEQIRRAETVDDYFATLSFPA